MQENKNLDGVFLDTLIIIIFASKIVGLEKKRQFFEAVTPYNDRRGRNWEDWKMRKKLSLDDLQKKRDALDARIKELQEAELRSVAEWVQQKTGCYSLEQLQRNGWTLMKRSKPIGEAEATPQP